VRVSQVVEMLARQIYIGGDVRLKIDLGDGNAREPDDLELFNALEDDVMIAVFKVANIDRMYEEYKKNREQNAPWPVYEGPSP